MTSSPALRIGLLAMLGFLGAAAGEAGAQTPGGSAAGAASEARIEIGVGIEWVSSYSVESGVASLTSNDGRSPFPLFRTSTDLGSAAGLRIAAGYRLSEVIVAEAGFLYRRPDLRTTVTADAESSGADFVIDERVSEYTFEGNALVAPRRWSFLAGRARPFGFGGLGYVRQLHEGGALVEHGWLAQAGGGAKYYPLTRPIGWFDGLGVRADVRVALRTGGIRVDHPRSVSGSAGVSVFARF